MSERIPLPEYADMVCHAYLPDIRPGPLYGDGVDGPHDPSAGHRFNPHTIVADAYAKSYASINFITAHDGFTPHDLVSYDRKHNDANGDNNEDGENPGA